MKEINYEQLRADLIDYFGTAMIYGFGAALIDIEEIESASNEKLIQIANQNGFNLNDYVKSTGFKL